MSNTHPVDRLPPIRQLAPFAAQHVLVMAAAPISSVFLTSKALGLSPRLTVDLLAASFVLSGIGSLLQSLGRWGVGVRLPFVMLPGGAPVILFIAIAQAHGLATASGAVILTSACYLVVLPLFARLLRFFPTVVIGTMIVVIGVNLVRASAVLVTGQPGTPGYEDPRAIGLGLATIGITVLFFRLLRGVFRQLAVMLGLLAGTALAALVGVANFHGLGSGGLVGVPRWLPFGPPHFDLLAALPLMIFALASMAEATGQTVLNAEVVGRELDTRRDVARTVRADALVSLAGGFLGTSLLVTSGENIGIVRVSGVRSRFVTAGAGVLLILIGIATPVLRAINAVPAPVVGGTGIVVYAIITVLGISMLRRVDLSGHANLVTCAAGLALGLLPILVPGLYDHFPTNARILLGSGVAMTAFVAVVLNIVFHHLGRRRSPAESPVPALSPTTAGSTS